MTDRMTLGTLHGLDDGLPRGLSRGLTRGMPSGGPARLPPARAGRIASPRAGAGFSLVEILVVLVIIGLLIGIVAPNVLQRADDARVQKVHADLRAIETALRLYRLDNHSFPSTEQGLVALVERPQLEPVPTGWKRGGYLPELPRDPWGRPYLYLYPAEIGSGDFDIYTLGADGVRGGDGINADIGNWQLGGRNE